MEYIHFIDSDDWLELECIEKCIQKALNSQAEIVWHNWNRVTDGISGDFSFPTLLDELKLNSNKVYTGEDIFSYLNDDNFSWTVMGIIKSNICYEIRFAEEIEGEDAIFGTITFAKSRRIAIIMEKIYHYRIRPYSVSQYTLNDIVSTSRLCLPPHQAYLEDFFSNVHIARYYRFSYSSAVICVRLKIFSDIIGDSSLKKVIDRMIIKRSYYMFYYKIFDKDPKNIQSIVVELQDYIKYMPLKVKFLYYFPRCYKIIKKLFYKTNY